MAVYHNIHNKEMKKDKVVIILGTAHLITSQGKMSVDGRLKEAVYSRERVSAISAILKGYGYQVFIDYEDLQPNSHIKSCDPNTEQSRELQYRVNKVNNLCKVYGKENCLYVSVHVDAAGMGTQWMNAGGWSAWTTKGQTTSDKLAECLYKAAEKNLYEYSKHFAEYKAQGLYGKNQVPLRVDKTDGDSDKEANFYVLKNTLCTAVLTENLFQDNKIDVDFLLSDAGMHAIERLHVEGILDFIHTN